MFIRFAPIVFRLLRFLKAKFYEKPEHTASEFYTINIVQNYYNNCVKNCGAIPADEPFSSTYPGHNTTADDPEHSESDSCHSYEEHLDEIVTI